ncbi:MAG: hypothetical protein K1X56_13630 [Flavobacteriales bacterium]|nr:hypothetical protein [Flavobacteriales bacterium]
MKKIIALFLLIQTTHSYSQKGNQDTLVLHLEKYANGKISAYSYLLNSTRTGRATAYTPDGKIMFDSEISRMHGSHSVTFYHHPNGVVSKIEEHSAPDAGIQWYNTTYFYNEKGELTDKRENNYNDRVTIQTPPDYKPQAVVECAVIYSNKTYFVNNSPYDLKVTYASRGESVVNSLKSGDTLYMGNQVQAQFFEDPSKTATFSAESLSKKKKAKKIKFEFGKANVKAVSPSEKAYYYEIRAILLR